MAAATNGRSTSAVAFAMPSGDSTFARRVQAEMSDPQRLADFDEFRRSLEDVWTQDFNDDIYLYRFFKAREFNPVKAAEMVRHHLGWRRAYRADNLLDEDFQQPDVVTRYYPGGFCGVDREGHPVWYEASGQVDPQGIARSVQRDLLLRTRFRICEDFVRRILPRIRRETGRPVYSCTFVVDMHGYGRRHLWGPALEFYGEFVRTCEQNYPETIGSAYVINAPAIFPVVFNIIKPLLHPETQKKIRVLGKNYRQVLQEAIHPDQLPKFYGGRLTDPDGDPRCRAWICWGGDVPKELYLRPNYPDRLLHQSIGRRAKFRVEMQLPAAGPLGLRLEWDFLTEDGDLGFEIAPVEPGQPLVRHRRVQCGICPCSGSVSCPQLSGLFAIVFDNSFSWLHSKRLRYFLHVTDRPLAPPVDGPNGCWTVGDAGADASDIDADAEADAAAFEANLEAALRMDGQRDDMTE